MGTSEHRVEGTVLDRFCGEPIEGVAVRLVRSGTGEKIGEATTGTDGRYDLLAAFDPKNRDSIHLELRDGSDLPIPHDGAVSPERLPGDEPALWRADLEALRSHGLSSGQELIAGEVVDTIAVKSLSMDALARAYRNAQRGDGELPSEIKAAFPEIERRPPPARREECGSIREPAALALAKLRPDFERAAFGAAHEFAPGDDVREYRGEWVRVTYVWDQGIGLGDQSRPVSRVVQPGAGGRDLGAITDEAPWRAQRIAQIADDAVRKFGEMGLPIHELWSTKPLEVRLLPGRFSGWTSSDVEFIQINPQDADRDFTVIPHEIFHRLQYRLAPDRDGDDEGLCDAVREGGARLAEDCIYDTANQYVNSAHEFCLRAHLSFFRRDDQAPYATGLFWKYLAETFGKKREPPTRGADVYLEILRGLGQRGHNLPALEAAVQDACGTPLADAWFGFITKMMLHNKVATGEFEFEEERAPSLRGHTISTLPLKVTPHQVADTKLPISFALPPFAADFHDVSPTRAGTFSAEISPPGAHSGRLGVFMAHLSSAGALLALERIDAGPVHRAVALEDKVFIWAASDALGGAAQVECQVS